MSGRSWRRGAWLLVVSGQEVLPRPLGEGSVAHAPPRIGGAALVALADVAGSESVDGLVKQRVVVGLVFDGVGPSDAVEGGGAYDDPLVVDHRAQPGGVGAGDGGDSGGVVAVGDRAAFAPQAR